jgi:hypothetical protein
MDFQHGKDHIELISDQFHSFNDLSGDIQYSASGATITFDANDSIFVANDHHLTASDFLFT